MWTEKRTCTGCRRPRERGSLLRFVADGRGVLGIDPLMQRGGRGVYVCPATRCIDNAVKRGGFPRGLKRKLAKHGSGELISKTVEALDQQLQRLVQQALEDGRARMCGPQVQVVEEKVRRQINKLAHQAHQLSGLQSTGGEGHDTSQKLFYGEDSKLHEGRRSHLQADGRD